MTISFLFKEIITCGAVLSTFELVEALRRLGHKAYIISDYENKELTKYFGISPIKKARGITIAVSPKCEGDYAYVRTKDNRWLNHNSKKIAVSDWIKHWVGADVTIGNGTHRRFNNMRLDRDIDILIEGNYEGNKNIEATIAHAQSYRPKTIVWFGRRTIEILGVRSITSPGLREIPTLYNRAKKFLKMSVEEGWGRPVAEAMACGCEVINLSGGNQEVKVVTWESVAKELINYIDKQND